MKGKMMKNSVEKIRSEIEKKGGLKSFGAAIRKNRDVNRPMKRMMNAELSSSDLTQEELNVAWHLGLIGNSGSVNGSIVKDSHID